MAGGLFLLLCLIALVLGTRARNSKYKALSKKEIKRKDKIKQIMKWGALVLIVIVLLGFLPFVVQEIKIAIDTHFQLDTLLAILLLGFGLLTVFTIIKNRR